VYTHFQSATRMEISPSNDESQGKEDEHRASTRGARQSRDRQGPRCSRMRDPMLSGAIRRMLNPAMVGTTPPWIYTGAPISGLHFRVRIGGARSRVRSAQE
jgi:hypothetical protein